MMNTRYALAFLTALLAVTGLRPAQAQAVYSEDFTGANTNNQWYFFNGACLTAGTSTSTASPGPVPSCNTILSTYYSKQADADKGLVGGNSGYLGGTTLPGSISAQVADPVGSGALRFTNGSPYGHNESGAILSSDTFDTGQGLQVTFKTITYRGDGGGTGKDGADGISFFLMDGSKPAGLGAFGGSLAYTCSNSNNNYDGLNGGYIGLGIDEYGNFLNGSNWVSGYNGPNAATGDNTAYGYGFKPGRIGMRGAGAISWTALNAAYGSDPGSNSKPYYPTSLYGACSTGTYYSATNKCGVCSGAGVFSTATGTCSSGTLSWGATKAESAVQNACSTGNLANYKSFAAPTSAGAALLSNKVNTAGILDYAPIPGAYKELTGFQIANENAVKRSDGTPIFYNLKITQDGLLSLSYSTGGAYSYVIKNQSITASNGPLPSSFRFGFAGSTGGSTNVHEIMCFKAASAQQSGSSATVNEKQAAKVEAGTQAYFAFYNPNNWTGSLTANNLIDTAGVVSVATIANWDASCLLSGTSAGAPATGGGCATTNASGPTNPTPAPASRVMLTYDTTNNKGIPFEWANLTTLQQLALNAGDASLTSPNRLNYLRGDTTNEINSTGSGLFRARDSILGDIVDSSPSWVGPPSSPYTMTWKDRLQPAASMPENSGTQSYLQYIGAAQTRLNVVYTGANDGFLHAFRSGRFDANGNFVADSTTPNDGKEIMAYMPGSTLLSAASSTATPGCTDSSHTGTVVQNIHGITPAIGAAPLCVDPTLDYASTQYGHNFFVDATPGTGDLFYGGTWHTWLVGGLGAGGAAIYALDVTDPTTFAETTAAATSTVLGEWNSNSITCVQPSNCGQNLGNTYGIPQIRRLHNGSWGVIFGNGFGSSSGDAGIYVMSVDSSGARTFYYLSTGKSGGNGIAYATPADLDGDHITDYVYAGDLLGNVWRFDLTNSDPKKWAAAAAPLFTTPTGQPITSQLLVISTVVAGSAPRLMIEFATGQRTQITNVSSVQYASGTQALYGVWDWDLTAWTTASPGSPYANLAESGAATGLSSPYTVMYSNLQSQTFTPNASTGVRDGTNSVVCWQGSTTCGSGNNKFGWYVTLPGTQEQVIFNPVFYQGAFVVNSTVPANNVPTSCTTNSDTGFTYAINVTNGGVFTNAFPKYTRNGVLITDPTEAGVQTDATGSVYVVTTAEGTSNIVYQTVSGNPGAQQINFPSNVKAKRLTWIERR